MSTEEFQALLADLGWLRTLARRLARDANAAEDLVQDACAIALRQPAPPLQWRAWLTEVLRNLVRAERRRDARQQRQLLRRQPSDIHRSKRSSPYPPGVWS